MGNFTMTFIITALINLFFILSQTTMDNLEMTTFDGTIPLAGSNYFNCSNDLINVYNTNCDYSNFDSNKIQDYIPSQSNQGQVSESSGNFFTDVFTSITNWFLNLPGINYLSRIFSMPYKIMNAMGLPHEFSGVIAMAWVVMSLMVAIAFFWWRD